MYFLETLSPENVNPLPWLFLQVPRALTGSVQNPCLAALTLVWPPHCCLTSLAGKPLSLCPPWTPHSGLCKEECPLCFPPAQLLPSKTFMHHWTEGSGLMEVLTGTCFWKAQHGGPTLAASPQLRVQAQSPLTSPRLTALQVHWLVEIQSFRGTPWPSSHPHGLEKATTIKISQGFLSRKAYFLLNNYLCIKPAVQFSVLCISFHEGLL